MTPIPIPNSTQYNTQALEAGAAQARKLEPKSGDGMTTASTTTKNKGDNSYNNTAPEEAGEGSNIHGEGQGSKIRKGVGIVP